MVCSWQFPLVSGLLQMTVEEVEEGRSVTPRYFFSPSLARGDDGASDRNVPQLEPIADWLLRRCYFGGVVDVGTQMN